MMASYLLPFPSTEHDSKLRYHVPTRASGGLWCGSCSFPTLNLSASHLPIVPLLRQGPGFLRDHFVWHSAFHFPLTSSFRPPFVSLLTYIEVLPHLVGSPPSQPPRSLTTPPDSHTHASFSPAPEQSGQLFPTSVVRTTQLQDSFRAPRSRPSQQPVSKQGDSSS